MGTDGTDLTVATETYSAVHEKSGSAERSNGEAADGGQEVNSQEVDQDSNASNATEPEPVGGEDDDENSTSSDSTVPTIPSTLHATPSNARLAEYKPKCHGARSPDKASAPFALFQSYQTLSSRVNVDDAILFYQKMSELLGPDVIPSVIPADPSLLSCDKTVDPVDLAELRGLLVNEDPAEIRELYDAIVGELKMTSTRELEEHQRDMADGDRVECLLDCYASIAGESTLPSTGGSTVGCLSSEGLIADERSAPGKQFRDRAKETSEPKKEQPELAANNKRLSIDKKDEMLERNTAACEKKSQSTKPSTANSPPSGTTKKSGANRRTSVFKQLFSKRRCDTNETKGATDPADPVTSASEPPTPSTASLDVDTLPISANKSGSIEVGIASAGKNTSEGFEVVRDEERREDTILAINLAEGRRAKSGGKPSDRGRSKSRKAHARQIKGRGEMNNVERDNFWEDDSKNSKGVLVLRDGETVPKKMRAGKKPKKKLFEEEKPRRGRSRGARNRKQHVKHKSKTDDGVDEEETGDLWDDMSRRSSGSKVLLEDGALVPRQALKGKKPRKNLFNSSSKTMKRSGRSRSRSLIGRSLSRKRDKAKTGNAKPDKGGMNKNDKVDETGGLWEDGSRSSNGSMMLLEDGVVVPKKALSSSKSQKIALRVRASKKAKPTTVDGKVVAANYRPPKIDAGQKSPRGRFKSPIRLARPPIEGKDRGEGRGPDGEKFDISNNILIEATKSNKGIEAFETARPPTGPPRTDTTKITKKGMGIRALHAAQLGRLLSPMRVRLSVGTNGRLPCVPEMDPDAQESTLDSNGHAVSGDGKDVTNKSKGASDRKTGTPNTSKVSNVDHLPSKMKPFNEMEEEKVSVDDTVSFVESELLVQAEHTVSKGPNWLNWDAATKSYETYDASRTDDSREDSETTEEWNKSDGMNWLMWNAVRGNDGISDDASRESDNEVVDETHNASGWFNWKLADDMSDGNSNDQDAATDDELKPDDVSNDDTNELADQEDNWLSQVTNFLADATLTDGIVLTNSEEEDDRGEAKDGRRKSRFRHSSDQHGKSRNDPMSASERKQSASQHSGNILCS